MVRGQFTSIGGYTRNPRVARLNSGGSLDWNFNCSADGTVRAMALQSDGKVVLAGDFLIVDSTSAYRMSRLSTDGTCDGGFINGNGFNGNLSYIALNSSQQIYAAGSYSYFIYTAKNNYARINSNGTLDSAFGISPTLSAGPILPQSDGKVWIGSNGIYRYNSDGTVDNSIFLGSNLSGTIKVLLRQSDGQVVICGSFTTFNGFTCKNIVRIMPQW